MRTDLLERGFVDSGALERTDERFREAGIALPTVAQLADPELVPAGIRETHAGVSRVRVHVLTAPVNAFMPPMDALNPCTEAGSGLCRYRHEMPSPSHQKRDPWVAERLRR